MTIIRILLAIVFSVSCLWSYEPRGKEGNDIDYVPGRLIIKFNDSTVQLPEFKQLNKGHVLITSGIEQLDAMSQEFGVTSIEQTIKSLKNKSFAKQRGVSNCYTLHFPPSADIEILAQKYSKLSEIEYAHPDYLFKTMVSPNDPLFADNWGHNNTSQFLDFNWTNENHDSGSPVGTTGFDAAMENAWNGSQVYGASNVKLAIIDTGVDIEHDDLANHIWVNSDEGIGDVNSDDCPGDCETDDDGDGLIDEDSNDCGWNPGDVYLDGDGNPCSYANDLDDDDDENGYIDDINGYDFGEIDSDPSDVGGHGTACAGIAAGVADNGIGVAGVAGNVTIMPLKVAYQSLGKTLLSVSATSKAIYYAADNGAGVISLSSGRDDGAAIPLIEEALEYAYNSGVVIFAATGNANFSNISFPANSEYVISVGAASPCGDRKRSSSTASEVREGYDTDPNGYTCDGERWWGSSFGSNIKDDSFAVDLLGPTILPTTDITGADGYDHLDAYGDEDYFLWFNGTSCATPYVAGAGALLLSLTPDLSPAQIRERLTTSATDIQNVESGEGWDRYSGYGMVNVEKVFLDHVILTNVNKDNNDANLGGELSLYTGMDSTSVTSGANDGVEVFSGHIYSAQTHHFEFETEALRHNAWNIFIGSHLVHWKNFEMSSGLIDDGINAYFKSRIDINLSNCLSNGITLHDPWFITNELETNYDLWDQPDSPLPVASIAPGGAYEVFKDQAIASGSYYSLSSPKLIEDAPDEYLIFREWGGTNLNYDGSITTTNSTTPVIFTSVDATPIPSYYQLNTDELTSVWMAGDDVTISAPKFQPNVSSIYEFSSWSGSNITFSNQNSRETTITFLDSESAIEAQYVRVDNIPNYTLNVSAGVTLELPDSAQYNFASGVMINVTGSFKAGIFGGINGNMTLLTSVMLII